MAGALITLSATRREVEVEVLEEEASGGGAVVVIWPLDDRAAHARELLEGLLAVMDVEAEVTVRRQPSRGSVPAAPATAILDVVGEDLGLLIGWRGETLHAVQTLLNMMMGDHERLARRIIVDIERYRARREAQVGALAGRMAERVRRTGERHMLEPMDGYERRAVHMALAADGGVRTESVGMGPARRVVIHPCAGRSEHSE